jgi:ribonuclease HI
MAPMKPEQQEMFESEKPPQPIRVFTDGAGARLDGKGSAYGFLRSDTGERQVVREDGLTNNQAEYKAVILALESLHNGMLVEICCDSQVVCAQLNLQYIVRDPKLASLWASVQGVIRRKNLTVTCMWVPRQENLAGKII